MSWLTIQWLKRITHASWTKLESGSDWKLRYVGAGTLQLWLVTAWVIDTYSSSKAKRQKKSSEKFIIRPTSCCIDYLVVTSLWRHHWFTARTGLCECGESAPHVLHDEAVEPGETATVDEPTLEEAQMTAVLRHREDDVVTRTCKIRAMQGKTISGVGGMWQVGFQHVINKSTRYDSFTLQD